MTFSLRKRDEGRGGWSSWSDLVDDLVESARALCDSASLWRARPAL